MATIIEFGDFARDRRQEEIRRLLEREELEVLNPEWEKAFEWILTRVKSGKCELICPDSINNFPLDENEHIKEWEKCLKDSENYLCALFRNPKPLSNIGYVRSLRPSATGMTEKAFLVEPSQSITLTTNAFRANKWDIFENAKVLART